MVLLLSHRCKNSINNELISYTKVCEAYYPPPLAVDRHWPGTAKAAVPFLWQTAIMIIELIIV